jgi:hypothetical protein
MVTLRHSPETCPAARPEFRDRCGAALGQFQAGSEEKGVVVHNWWADTPGHLFYFLVEAPNAHAIAELVGELELSHWSTLETRAVVQLK